MATTRVDEATTKTTPRRQHAYALGVIAALALPLAEVFQGKTHGIHLLEFMGGAT